MKKLSKALIFALILSMLLTGCGNSYDASDRTAPSENYVAGDYSESQASKSSGLNIASSDNEAYEAAGEYADEDYEAEEYTDKTDSSNSENADIPDTTKQKAASNKKGNINKDMLVYTGNVRLNTEKFDDSYKSLKELVEKNDGFIENENYSEQSSDSELFKSVALTIRVPSKNFNALLDSFGDIGTVSSKTTNVENVSQEYSENAAALDIYEAKEDRYIEQLKTVKDESTMLELENTLTDIQIQIARLKSRQSAIETDVAYSYINVNLTESTFHEAPETSFGGRLLNSIKRSWHSFVTFVEGLIIVLVMILPELLFTALFIFIIVKLIKRSSKKRAAKKEKKAQEAQAAAANPDAQAFAASQDAQAQDANANQANNNQ